MSEPVESRPYLSDGVSAEVCHCGRPVHVYDEPGMGGFTRDMCLECSTVRCDIGPCPADKRADPATWSEAGATRKRNPTVKPQLSLLNDPLLMLSIGMGVGSLMGFVFGLLAGHV